MNTKDKMNLTEKGCTSYIAINSYRSSTDHGFANTWKIYRLTKELRKKMLTGGLPVRDCCGMDGAPVLSTMGIRAATPAEIRDLKKEERNAGFEIEAYEIVESDECKGGICYTR